MIIEQPDEDSITTPDHERFYQYGKLVFQLTETVSGIKIMGSNKAYPNKNAAIKAYLDKVQFWPDVFFISDHGNAHLIRYWEER